jgi:hypothetical protein
LGSARDDLRRAQHDDGGGVSGEFGDIKGARAGWIAVEEVELAKGSAGHELAGEINFAMIASKGTFHSNFRYVRRA